MHVKRQLTSRLTDPATTASGMKQWRLRRVRWSRLVSSSPKDQGWPNESAHMVTQLRAHQLWPRIEASAQCRRNHLPSRWPPQSPILGKPRTKRVQSLRPRHTYSGDTLLVRGLAGQSKGEHQRETVPVTRRYLHRPKPRIQKPATNPMPRCGQKVPQSLLPSRAP